MKPSDVEILGGQLETSISCNNCGEVFSGSVYAEYVDDPRHAQESTVENARDIGWTDGPLCPDCSKKQGEDK